MHLLLCVIYSFTGCVLKSVSLIMIISDVLAVLIDPSNYKIIFDTSIIYIHAYNYMFYLYDFYGFVLTFSFYSII